MATDDDRPDDDWAIYVNVAANLVRIGLQPTNAPLRSNWQWCQDEESARQKLAALLAEGYQLADGGW